MHVLDSLDRPCVVLRVQITRPPPTTKLLGNHGCRARPTEWINHQITGIGCSQHKSSNQFLGLLGWMRCFLAHPVARRGDFQHILGLGPQRMRRPMRVTLSATPEITAGRLRMGRILQGVSAIRNPHRVYVSPRPSPRDTDGVATAPTPQPAEPLTASAKQGAPEAKQGAAQAKQGAGQADAAEATSEVVPKTEALFIIQIVPSPAK